MQFSKLLIVALLAGNTTLLCMQQLAPCRPAILCALGEGTEQEPQNKRLKVVDASDSIVDSSCFPRELDLLAFQARFGALKKADQKSLVRTLQTHETLLASVLKINGITALIKKFEALAFCDIVLTSDEARRLLAAHKIHTALKAELGEDHYPLLHPVVLSLFSPELAQKMHENYFNIRRFNLENGANVSKARPTHIVVVETFHSIREESKIQLKRISKLLAAIALTTTIE